MLVIMRRSWPRITSAFIPTRPHTPKQNFASSPRLLDFHRAKLAAVRFLRFSVFCTEKSNLLMLRPAPCAHTISGLHVQGVITRRSCSLLNRRVMRLSGRGYSYIVRMACTR
eukprot:6180358-Pleurochrysis_carterae.AAC.2